MFESAHGLTTGALRSLVIALASLDPNVDDAERIDQIRLLEELKAAAAAAQALVTVAFAASQERRQAAQGVPADRVSRGVAAQVGLARRESPFHATRYVGWSRILTAELPRTFAELRAGRVNERRAMIVARETAWLSREHRADVDQLLAGRLGKLGDRRVEAESKRLAYRCDPHGYVARIRGADRDRRVTLRPAPDAMTRLTALLPVAQGVAAYAALARDADSLVAQGDSRGRGQLMADTLVERVTGQTAAPDVPIEVNLIMTDMAMFNIGTSVQANEPAEVVGHGPVPAEIARRLIADRHGEVSTWVRRLYTRPDDGQLVGMDSRRRTFTGPQRTFLVLRDQVCRTPWCEAPIRHADHVVPSELGGSTSVANGAGLCAACNFAKQAPGWRGAPLPDGQVAITTPTGHLYHSRPPDPPGAVAARRSRPKMSPVEIRFRDLVVAA